VKPGPIGPGVFGFFLAKQGLAMANAMGGTGQRRRAGVAVKLLIVGAALGAGVIGIYALGGGRGLGSGGAAGAMTADMATVSMMSFEVTTTATGELQAKNQIELRCELESESSIVEIAPEGIMVKAGDLLARLNSDQIQSQIDEALLRVASGKSDLVAAENAYKITESENDSKIRQAKLKLELARLALDQWQKGERVQKIKDIDLALERTERELTRLQDYLKQSEVLAEAGFLSKNELEKDRIAVLEAVAARAKAELDQKTYLTYQQATDEKTKTSNVEEAIAELERVTAQAEIQLAVKDADRVNKRRTLTLHEEKLAKLQRNLAACTILAPQDGLVVYATSAGKNWSDEPFTVGRRVRPQETLMVLPDTSEMVAAVRVHESLTGRMRVGQLATVKVDAVGGKVFDGRVDSISVMAETQDRWRSDPNRREYVVKIVIGKTGTETQFKPSMRCEANITLGRVDDVATLPIQAIFSDEAVKFVYVPRGSKFVRVPVQIGKRSDMFAEVVAGLEPGQRVLLREPTPGEVIQEPWDPAQLKLVGFQVGADGKPQVIGSGPGGKPGSGPPMGRGGAGEPGGAPGAPEAGRGRQGGQRGNGGPGGSGPRPDGKPAQAASPEPKSGAPAAPEAKPETKQEVGR